MYIENDGVITSSEQKERIFERFYTEEAPKANRHLGVGLSIAKMIIEGMEGTIFAEIDNGVITFEISLPLV
uniref:histidine kinase n=1 Tax=Candidatus Enterococcus mansonii TaxID=1834181 RepID=A0A242C6A7_9ENTE|nr:hypothetical protein A5880_002864 [Enterococcus sp. 4G2_DIV0659]